MKNIGNCMALDDTGMNTKAGLCDEKKKFFCAQVAYVFIIKYHYCNQG